LKFTPRKLEKTSEASGGEGSQSRELGMLVLMTLALLLALYFVVSLAIDAVVSNISIETEKRLFSGYRLPSRFAVSTDPGKAGELKKIEEILRKLAAHPDTPGLNYRLFLVQHDKPNAFAFPGGGIGITSGLMEKLQEEISIAFVLGHELGHFRDRDHLKGLGRAIGLNICYALISSQSSGAELIGRNTLFFMGRRYSQGQEKAADRFGVKLVYDTYGEVEGMDRLFKLLDEEDEVPAWAYMLSTHPDPGERIADMGAYAEKLRGG
jgi:predicted Zn-dependent protease